MDTIYNTNANKVLEAKVDRQDEIIMEKRKYEKIMEAVTL